MSDTDDLHGLLASAAADAPLGSDDLAATVIARHQRRRRNRQVTALAVAAVAVVVAGVGVPLLGRDGGAPPQTQTVDQQTVDVLTGQPRGNLAGDAALVAELRAQTWGAVTPAAETRQVVYVGDVGALRTALVIGEDRGRRIGLWFTGPRGASATRLQPASAAGPIVADQPLVRLDTSVTPNALIVISAPGDQVALSAKVTVTAEGALDRTYRALPTDRGVAATTVETTTPYGEAASVRIQRAGTTVYRGPPMSTTPSGPAPSLGPVGVPAGQPQPPAALVDQFAADLARATGLDPHRLGVHATWSGTLPGPDGARAAAAVLTATYPSGATVVASGWVLPGHGAAASSAQYCSFQFQPASSRQAPLAARCDVTADGQRVTSTILLLSAQGATSADLIAGNGTTTASIPLPAGAGQVPATGGEQRAVFSIGQRRVAAVSISPWFSGDLGRYGSGPR